MPKGSFPSPIIAANRHSSGRQHTQASIIFLLMSLPLELTPERRQYDQMVGIQMGYSSKAMLASASFSFIALLMVYHLVQTIF